MSDVADSAALAAAEWNLPTPVLLRKGMSSLFTAGSDVVLRVSRPAFPPSADRQWHSQMASLGVRVPQLLHDMEGPDGSVILAMERLHSVGPIDWAEVGAMVGRVHTIDLSRTAELPACSEFAHWQIETVLDGVRDLVDLEALRGMQACLQRWNGWRDRAVTAQVVCHGDVHPGNVVQTAEGAVLLDWDLRCHAPAGWDHAALMTASERWSYDPGIYQAFAEGYGRSLRGDWMAEAFAELRLLVATLMRLRAGRSSPAAADEAEQRLRWWRGDPGAPKWEPQ
jgi:hypothetical protein